MNKEVRKNERAAKPKREKRKELLLGPCLSPRSMRCLRRSSWRQQPQQQGNGDVVFSVGAQVHAERRHPKEFLLCFQIALLPYKRTASAVWISTVRSQRRQEMRRTWR